MTFRTLFTISVTCGLVAALGCGSKEPKRKLGPGVQHDRPVRVPKSSPSGSGSRNNFNQGKSHPLAGRSGGLGDLLEDANKNPGGSRGKMEAQGGSQHSVGAGNQTNLPALPSVDEEKIRAAGIRKIAGDRLVLYTDLPADPEIDELPQVFDAAFDKWCRYFGLNLLALRDWQMRASLMDDKAKFVAADLLPDDLPNFLNGYTRDRECWLYNQTSPYYRRHLLLHEGVHGVMFTLVGSNAQPWYLEGMAELLATHRWQGGAIEAPYFPKKADEVSKLGRIEIVQTDFANKAAKHLADVWAYDSRAHLKVESYGWSWAAVAFLDGHPRYRDRFRKLQENLKTGDDFNAKLRETYANDAALLAEDWQVFVANLTHGYDFDRTAIDYKPGQPLAAKSTRTLVAANRGWQNSGLRLEAGRNYRLAASGKFQVSTDPKPWMSEPAGVSIRYIQGKPLGMLLAAVRPDDAPAGVSALLKPIDIGAGATLAPTAAGTLYFKVNDSPGELADNAGNVEVEIAVE